jgi:hypothetical protein
MRINIDTRDLAKLTKLIERMETEFPLAIARGLNEGGDKVRTQVQRALKTQTGLVRYSSVTSRVRTARAYATGNGALSGIGPSRPASLSYAMFVSPKSTKIFEYKTKVKKGPGGGVTAWLWGAAHVFKRSFAGSGELAGKLKMRTEKGRLPLRSFKGANLAKEAVKDASAEAFFSTVETAIAPAMFKHLMKLL